MLSTCESAFNCSSTQAASAHQPDNHLDAAAWLRAQDVSPLVIVLRHTSARVQLRAARLALLLAQSDVWCEVFVETPGALQAACRLACDSGGGSGNGSGCEPCARTLALRLLCRLATASAHAVVDMAAGSHLQETLIAELLQHACQTATAPAGAGGAGTGQAGRQRAAAGAGAVQQVRQRHRPARVLACSIPAVPIPHACVNQCANQVINQYG
jgi:hypothetical protein